uniref:Reverse transcriptase domain-containing protein n=1 Tax=Fagus sylvatica TaxID=28930 RepID=A0A2N9GNE4_FAGSY
MAGETSGPGPSEQEIRMVALERKFDELLSFVQLIAKRNTDDENQRKEDDKDTSEAEPEGHSNTNATPPRPPTPPKPEGEGLPARHMSWFPNMTVPPKFKAPEFEKYNGRGDPMIHLQMYCRKMAPYADNEPLLIQTFQDTLTGNAAEWYSQLKKISHWKELADTFLAQYGFNSQIAPDRFDLQRMEKKSNETFREYAQRWREKAARARPPLDEREMIKIFVDTLKNPYFDRMMGLQMQFFVDLIPVGDRIEDALKTKKIVDMTALMALAEQAAKKAPTKKKEGDVQMIGRNNGRPRQPRPRHLRCRRRPEGNQPNDNRWLRKEPRQFTPLPMPMTELYPILIEKSLISPIVPKPYSGPQRRDFNPNSACDFHFGEVGHTVENCGQLRHRVQDLIDHGVLKFEGLPNITTNPLPKHPEGGVNMVEVEEGNEESIAWRRLFYTLEKQKHITPLDAPPGPSTGDSCEYHSGARGHSLDCCEEFKKKVTDLMENGIVGREEIPSKGSRQPDDPSDFDWYAEINLDNIVEDEMDLDNLQDEEADWGYFMEDDTDEWRDVDFTEFFQFPCLDSATWLRNLTGWDDLVRVFLERYRFNPHSILEYLGLKKDEEPYIIPDPGHWLREKEERSQSRHHQAIITTTVAEEEYAGPMVEGLSIHTITEEEDSTTTPPARHCQQGRRCQDVDLRTIATACLKITRKTSNDPHVSKIDNKTDCSLDNIDNSDEEIELPSDILEALERQDEGSKPNIEELEIVNLANEGEEPREVKIGTRCAAEQKEALIALLREFHENLRLPEVILKIKEEVEKQLKAGFLSTVTYSDWVANIVPVPKKDGKVRMCVDYRDLNRASPKDNFPLPHIDTLVDNTATNVVFSFMDGFSGYNQIKMAEEDKSKTAFVTHWGTFVYDVMPFGLKNAGATYQRAMVTLFHDMIHHEIEVYVDDMIAKSRTAQDHLTDLRKLFQRLKKYQLRLNPNKCAFGVTSGKLLGFITAREAFDKIKEYLLNPPILVPPTPGRPLILYLTVQEASMGCMLGQQDETGKKEQAIYYLSKKFTEPETRYLLVEKTCCALAWASKKLRQYMLYYTTWLVSRMDPIKYIFEKPALTGKIARWQVLLSEFDILFVARKAIKGQAIADYLADYPSEQLELMDSEFPDEDGQQTPIAVKLGFDCTNNMTEYEACIVGLQAALEFGAYELEVFGDSLLIVSQTNGEWQARDPKLIPYQRYISRLVPKFKYVTFTYTPRAHNHFADALATLASLIKLAEGDDVRPLRIETRDIPRHTTCHKCQMYQNSKNAPPQYLHTMASPWPFSAWGMDVIGAITPKASNGHEFILVAIDYFTKWVGGVFLQECHSSRGHPVCEEQHYLPLRNARNAHHRQCFQPEQPHDGPVMPAVQDSAPQLCSIPPEDERSRRSCQQEREEDSEQDDWRLIKDWHEHLPYALCALTERHFTRGRIERAYNKKARPRTFQPGDLVLKKRNMALSDPRGKFAPSYEGPYVVKKAFSGGAIILADMDGEEFRSPINSDSVIKYHV